MGPNRVRDVLVYVIALQYRSSMSIPVFAANVSSYSVEFLFRNF